MSSEQFHEQWIHFATEDLTVAQLVYNEEHYAHSCFLSQQSIEKALKGFLIAHSNEYPRIHNLVDLLTLCQNYDQDFTQFLVACSLVDKFYIPTRYPAGIPGSLPDGPPSKAQAQKSIAYAREILDYTIQKTFDLD